MDCSFEGIRDSIKAGLENPVNKIEGSFSMDNIQAVSQELARIMAMEVLPIPDWVLLDTAEGIMLDRRAIDFNEKRNPAMKAVGCIQFFGKPETIIPEGTMVIADELEFTVTASATIGDAQTISVPAQCTTAGKRGNIAAGGIAVLKAPVKGIGTVEITDNFTGGVDEEGDEAFRARVLEKIRRPITSGNKNHYAHWAKQVSGVGRAKVQACWNGNGTVKVTILSDTLGVPDDTVLQNVQKHIEENRPIGAAVTVAKAVPIFVTVDVTVVLAEGYSLDSVKPNMQRDLTEYFNEIAFVDKSLSYYKVGDIVFGVEGIADITSYTLNGGLSSLQPRFEEFFVLQEVVVNVD